MRKSTSMLGVACAVLLLTTATTLEASWSFLEDFETLSLGSSINGQNGWFAEAGSGSSSRLVAVDPTDGSNQVVDINSGGSSDMSRDMSFGANETGTIYARFFIPALNEGGTHNEPDMQFGASTLNPPVAAASAGPAYRVDWNGSQYVLQVRNDSNDGFLTPAILENNVWYELWMTFDNATDLYGGHIRGGAFATQTELNVGGQTEFHFRNQNSDPISSLALRMNLNHVDDKVLADDFFFTTGLNLDTPELVTMSALVHPLTGVVFLANDTDDPISFDSYEISSSQGALLPGDGSWNSLDDQNYDATGPSPGQSWDESAGSSATVLAERFLAGFSTLAPGESVSLGAAYDTAIVDSTMSLVYYDLDLTTHQGADLEFILPGDMDGNGTLEEADLNPFVQALTDRAGYESTYPGVLADLIGDFNGNSRLDLGDVAGMIAAVQSLPASGAGTSVPEPDAAWLFAIACLLSLGTVGRNNKRLAYARSK